MRKIYLGCVFLLLGLQATADSWTDRLTPRQRQSLGTMLRSDWSPAREVELNAAERQELRQIWERIQVRPAPPPEPPAAPSPPASTPPPRQD